MNIKESYKVLFLLFLVLGVYYPALFAGINSVDDWRMLANLSDQKTFDYWQLLRPSTGFYYRPLLMLSFIMDKFLWGLEPSFMHLENILLHACNTLLVFFIAKQVFPVQTKNSFELPLLTALVFALHPINTESVNWISGRTDLLGAFFTLLATFLLIKGSTELKTLPVVLSSLCLILGIMSKEVMLFFYPAGCILLYLWPTMKLPSQPDKTQRLKLILIFSLPFLSCGIFYLLFRVILFSQNDQGMNHLAQFPQFVSYKMIGSLFKVFGFYIKKLFIPVPLNFAITRIDSYYLWIGIASFIIALFMAAKRSVASSFFLVSFYLITPAAIIAIAGVAWTPIAERYLYLASAFWSVGLVSLLCNWLNCFKKNKIIPLSCIACLLLSFILITSNRNIQWQDNVKLYQDAKSQNPNFTSINNELAIALIDAGKFDEAEKQLTEGINNPENKNPLLYINLARIKMEQNKIGEARQILFNSFSKKEEGNQEVLKMLAFIDEKRIMLGNYDNDEKKLLIIKDLLETYKLVYEKDNNPFSLYRFGQLALFIGLKTEARTAFARAYKEAPSDAHYKKAAGILAQKLADK